MIPTKIRKNGRSLRLQIPPSYTFESFFFYNRLWEHRHLHRGIHMVTFSCTFTFEPCRILTSSSFDKIEKKRNIYSNRARLFSPLSSTKLWKKWRLGLPLLIPVLRHYQKKKRGIDEHIASYSLTHIFTRT